MIIARVIMTISYIVIAFCFDERKWIIGWIAMQLMIFAILYELAHE